MRVMPIICLLLVACGGAGVSAPSSSSSSARATANASAGASASAAGPITSTKGWITVRQPVSGARVRPPVAITGDASVFEGTLQWRVVDGGGRVLAEGHTTATAGAPGRGAFSVTATFTPPTADTSGAIEVYSRSPKDGQIDDLVRVPVVITR